MSTSPDTKPDVFPSAVNTDGLDFVANTVNIDHAVHKEVIPTVRATVQRVLGALDKDCQELERLLTVGAVVSVERQEFNVPVEDLKRLFGPKAWEQLESLAKDGRAMLQSRGFVKVVRGRPAVMLAPTGNTASASAMVQPSATRSRDGNMDLERVGLVPTSMKNVAKSYQPEPEPEKK